MAIDFPPQPSFRTCEVHAGSCLLVLSASSLLYPLCPLPGCPFGNERRKYFDAPVGAIHLFTSPPLPPLCSPIC